MFSRKTFRLSFVAASAALVAFVGFGPGTGRAVAADEWVYVSNMIGSDDPDHDGTRELPYATAEKALAQGRNIRFLPNRPGNPYPVITVSDLMADAAYSFEAIEGPGVTQVNGIVSSGLKEMHILGFTIINPVGTGITCINAKDCTISNCVIAYCRGGIVSDGQHYNVIVNNCVLYMNIGDVIKIGANRTFYLNNCIVSENSGYVASNLGTWCSIFLNYCFVANNNLGNIASAYVNWYAQNTLTSGLAFVNPNNCDFHLKHPNDDPSDPGLFRQGHPGIRNPDGSRSDLGAYGGPDCANWFRRKASTRPVIGSVTTKATNDGTGNVKVTVQVKAQ
jgi:parallel beta-helix repeat protein